MIVLSKAGDTSGEMGVRAVVLSSQRNNNKKIEIHMEVQKIAVSQSNS